MTFFVRNSTHQCSSQKLFFKTANKRIVVFIRSKKMWKNPGLDFPNMCTITDSRLMYSSTHIHTYHIDNWMYMHVPLHTVIDFYCAVPQRLQLVF